MALLLRSNHRCKVLNDLHSYAVIGKSPFIRLYTLPTIEYNRKIINVLIEKYGNKQLCKYITIAAT